MKNTVGVLFCLYGCLWVACQSEPKEESVKEIRNGANADLVRNPVTADGTTDTTQMARLTFEEAEYDFGEVKEGDLVEHKFKFINTGKTPLLISNARSSCGCTVPEWPTEPVKPGESGEIYAKFNTSGRTGLQKKLIYVTANSLPSQTSIMLKGQVK
ncbi:MAG: DUF1573 domain-containing protein [Saprospiraceae bacterium]